MNKNTLAILMAVAVLAGCSRNTLPLATSTPSPTTIDTTSQQVRNVIFIIGDGMGTAQVYASITAHKDSSQFLRFPFTGFSRTYSNSDYTTDSGAGGTALMTGHKVNNYAIAQSPDGENYPSLLATAHQRLGKATGFVVTSSVLDATPASTYGHVSYRKMFDTLSLQMAQCPIDVMIGADRRYFHKSPIHKDSILMSRGYSMAYSLEELDTCRAPRICALLSPDDEPGNAAQRHQWLVAGTHKAIATLSQDPQGFVLMVEGSQIDWACHNNDAEYLLTELDEFERTIALAIDFATRDGHTLVVVTADHETGGLALTQGDTEQGTSECKFVTGSHTGVMVPVFAFGPGAHHFSGVHQNTDFYPLILKLLNP